MIGILVFTNQKVLDHKLRDGKNSENRWCFWEMKRFPKKIKEMTDYEEEIRLYFAIKGKVKGYFIIHDLDDGAGTLDFYSESWHPIKDGEQLKPSQGFRYYNH